MNAQPAKPPKSSNRKILLIIGAVVLVLCLICGIFGAVNNSASPKPTADVKAIYTSAMLTALAPLTQTAALPAGTSTPQITATFTSIVAPTKTPQPTDFFAWNYVGKQNSGGVILTIARVVVADKSAVNADFSPVSVFNNRNVVASLVFIVQNTTSKTISIYPDQGKIVGGNEQINLRDFMIGGARFGENFSGDLLPGVQATGGIWFGFQRTQLQDIQSLQVNISAPFDASSFTPLGPDYNFVIDLRQRKDDAIPPELQFLAK